MKTSSGEKSKKRRSKTKKIVVKRSKAEIAESKKRKVDWLRLERYKSFRLAGHNRYRSAKLAGYAETTARHQAHRYDRLSKVGIIEALEDAGATNAIMARALVNIAENATRMQSCTIEVRDNNGDLTIEDESRREIPDRHLRKETWELIAKLKKQLSNQSIIPDGNFTRLVVVLEREAEPKNDRGSADQSDKQTVARVALTD